MCRVLEVSTSGYYAWRRRKASVRQQEDEALLAKIKVIYQRSRESYGAPRLHIQLAKEGTYVGRKRVARLMQQANLRGVSRRRWPVTTVRSPRARPAPDLVERDFSASAPNQLWVADITYVPTARGFLYLAVVLDVFGRRIVGWSMKKHLKTSLVQQALDMALRQRRPRRGLIHHSDQGCQYTSLAFGARCRQAGIRPSMGSVGDCYDNALCESFFATLECELLHRHHFQTHQQASLAVFDYIEGWYNPHRLHSSLGYCSPAEFERNYYQQHSVPN
jgi:transposase InsO family protein